MTRADAANWIGINCCKCWASVCCITEFRESKRNSVCMKCSCASSSLASLFNELTKGKNKYNVSQLWTNHKQRQQRLPFAMRRGGEGFWKYTNIWICSLRNDYCCIHVCFWLHRPYLLPFIHFNDSALLISRVWWIMVTGRKTGNVWSTGTWWNNDWCGWSHIHVPGPIPSAVAGLWEKQNEGCEKKVPTEINSEAPPSCLLCGVYQREKVTVGGVLPSRQLGVCGLCPPFPGKGGSHQRAATGNSNRANFL